MDVRPFGEVCRRVRVLLQQVPAGWARSYASVVDRTVYLRSEHRDWRLTPSTAHRSVCYSVRSLRRAARPPSREPRPPRRRCRRRPPARRRRRTAGPACARPVRRRAPPPRGPDPPRRSTKRCLCSAASRCAGCVGSGSSTAALTNGQPRIGWSSSASVREQLEQPGSRGEVRTRQRALGPAYSSRPRSCAGRR